MSKTQWTAASDDLGLSPRQAQIVRALFDGLGDQGIADRLGMAMPTLRTHVSRLFARFEVQDRVGLVLHIFWCFRQTCSGSGHPQDQ